MIPARLHSLSIAVLLLGLVCAMVIAADLVRHKKHMWIMNVVWPVTALFGTLWIVWQHFTYRRLAEDARAKDAMARLLGTKLSVDTVEFWFMMQIAMICGFLTAYPVNWWLIRTGLKEKM